MDLFEDDAAGLIERLDWLEVRRAAEEYQPDELDEVLVEAVDDLAYAKLVEVGFRWDLAKSHALAVLDTIISSERVKLYLRGVEVTVPKPSRALKLLSIDALRLPLTDDEEVALTFLALFDGEEARSLKLLREFYLVDPASSAAVQLVADYVNRGFTVVTYRKQQLLGELERAGLSALRALLLGLEGEGRLVDASELVRGAVGCDASADEVAAHLGLRLRYGLEDVRREYEESLRRIRGLPYSKWLSFTQYLSSKAEAYVADRARAIYLAYLALRQLGEKGN